MFTATLKPILLIACLLVICGNLYAQADSIPVRNEQFVRPPAVTRHTVDLGFGIGIDYGGLLGIQLGYAPIKYLTLFASGGYYILGFGWQVGAKGLVLPKTTKNIFRPLFKVMYGTHAIIIVDGASEYDKIYTGFTAGIGVELRFGKKKQNGFDLDFNFPMKTADYWEDWNAVKNDPRLEIIQEPGAVTFSIGFHHEF